MKIFISGDTVSLTSKDRRLKFNEAEIYLKKLNYDVVNPLKIDCESLAPWTDRLVILTSCDAIFLLSNWLNSKESMMEKYYSSVTGKDILFESCIEEENKINCEEELIISRIKGAIEEVTGLTFAQYTEDDRKTTGFYCRMIFAIHCLKAKISDNKIIHDTGRSYYSIRYYQKQYDSEYQFNKKFRVIAERVNQKLYPVSV